MGRAVLSEWPLKLLAFLATSKLLVAASIPAGVAKNFNELAQPLKSIPANNSNKLLAGFKLVSFFGKANKFALEHWRQLSPIHS